jgi:signal transduction histidine kinase/CheY-like chemotaxis protein
MSVNPAFAQDLEIRRIDQLFRQSSHAVYLCFANIFVFVTIGWNLVPHSYLITWAIIWQSSTIFRTMAARKWRHLVESEAILSLRQLRHWNLLFIGGCWISGICLGLMAAMSRIYLEPDEQLYLGLMVLAMTSSSIMAYMLSLPSALGVLILDMAIWTGTLIYTHAHWPMLFFTILYVISHIFLARNWHLYAKNSLQMTFDLFQNQERLRLAMDSSGAASWSWDPRSDVFACDENMSHVLGSKSSNFHCLQDYLEHIHPEDRVMVRKAFFHALQTELIDIEHRLFSYGAAPQIIALKGKVQGGQSSPRSLSGISWDITDKKNEEHLRFERDLLEKSNHAKLMFLANVSHEIRTPLTAINGFAENVLSDRQLAPRLREQIGVILRSGKYLTSVVHDLLDLSKAEADSIYIQKSNVSLAEEINDAVHAVHSAIEKKNLKLNVTYLTPVPETVVSDATRLRQILINLLSNSVKYTEQGQIDIRVSFESSGHAGRLRIVVSDTGIGISERDSRKLFQPFTRGDSHEVRQRQGSGLGLVLSRTLALRMGGDLRLLSTVPRTEFSQGSTAFELTVETGSCTGVRLLKKHLFQGSTVTELEPTSPTSFKNCRFLVVDDDEDIRWLLEDYLEQKSAHVVLCEHGGEAVKNAFNARFDAVLMDIKMPLMDGYQATALLRQRGFRNPIIALTAHANSSDMLKCYEAGCDFYISKPIDFRHLDDVLKRSLEIPLATSRNL